MQGRTEIILLLMLAASLQATSVHAEDDSGRPVVVDNGMLPSQLPIHSQSDLETWLNAHQAENNPLSRLTPGGRERFRASLHFDDYGAHFDPGLLSAELTEDEMRPLLALLLRSERIDRFLNAFPPADIRTRSVARQRSTGIGDLERRYNRFYVDGVIGSRGASDLQFPALFERAYERNMAPVETSVEVTAASDSELQLRLWAATETAQHANGTGIVDIALRLFKEYDRRGLASESDIRSTLTALLNARRFDAAKALVTEHPHLPLPSLPLFENDRKAGDHSVWALSNDGSTLTRQRIDLRPTQIIVISGCHFAEDAADALSADPVLGPAFARHARWISLPPGQEDLDALREWNQKRRQTPMMAVYDRAEWADIAPVWAMPTFVIVRDGKPVETIQNSLGNDRIEQLTSALRRNGLLDD
jgi:hypothetical protein